MPVSRLAKSFARGVGQAKFHRRISATALLVVLSLALAATGPAVASAPTANAVRCDNFNSDYQDYDAQFVPYGAHWTASLWCSDSVTRDSVAGAKYFVSYQPVGGAWTRPRVAITSSDGTLTFSRSTPVTRNFRVRWSTKSHPRVGDFQKVKFVKVHPAVTLRSPSDSDPAPYAPGEVMLVLASARPSSATCQGIWTDYGDIHRYPVGIHYGLYKWMVQVPVPSYWTEDRFIVGVRCWGKGLAYIDESTATYRQY